MNFKYMRSQWDLNKIYWEISLRTYKILYDISLYFLHRKEKIKHWMLNSDDKIQFVCQCTRVYYSRVLPSMFTMWERRAIDGWKTSVRKGTSTCIKVKIIRARQNKQNENTEITKGKKFRVPFDFLFSFWSNRKNYVIRQRTWASVMKKKKKE